MKPIKKPVRIYALAYRFPAMAENTLSEGGESQPDSGHSVAISRQRQTSNSHF
jgi:hypothetical protein